MKRIAQFIKNLRPVFTFDELRGTPRITVDIAVGTEEAGMKELFEYLGSSEKRCYIAIDEFQQIGEYPENGIKALLRSYMQFLPSVSFIFAGSKQHVMQEMFMSAKRPFHQSTQILPIDCIERGEYYRFASVFFARQGRARCFRKKCFHRYMTNSAATPGIFRGFSTGFTAIPHNRTRMR